MGTSSITHVFNEDGVLLVSLQGQMDGYLEGHGKELVDFIDGKKIINGITPGKDLSNSFNGMECLAAALVAHFKTSIGDYYLAVPVDEMEDELDDYVYRVKLIKNQITITANGKRIYPKSKSSLKKSKCIDKL